MIFFRVFGVPAAQGSMRAINHKYTGRAILIHNKTQGLAAWRRRIADAAEKAREQKNGILEGPVQLVITFHLPKPSSRPKVLRTAKQREKWAYPRGRPDLSKLVRAAEDAVIGVLIRDDGQIVWHVNRKIYSDAPGAEVELRLLDGTEEDGSHGDGCSTQAARTAARAGAGEGAGGQRA